MVLVLRAKCARLRRLQRRRVIVRAHSLHGRQWARLGAENVGRSSQARGKRPRPAKVHTNTHSAMRRGRAVADAETNTREEDVVAVASCESYASNLRLPILFSTASPRNQQMSCNLFFPLALSGCELLGLVAQKHPCVCMCVCVFVCGWSRRGCRQKRPPMHGARTRLLIICRRASWMREGRGAISAEQMVLLERPCRVGRERAAAAAAATASPK